MNTQIDKFDTASPCKSQLSIENSRNYVIENLLKRIHIS